MTGDEMLASWREEKSSSYLYQVMAESDQNILHKKLFLELKESADKQAALWEKKLAPATPVYYPSLRVKIIAFLIRKFGTENMHSILPAMKIRGMSIFRTYHSEHKHTSLNTTSNLRASIFGMNDGLVSNMSLILGIAGASSNHQFILLAGVAGLLAGALSMGAGEYISVRSQREVFEYQIAIEKKELEEYPEEEMEELSLIYQARGLSKEHAESVAKVMINNPATGLDTLAREELGLNPEDLVSPIGAMVSSFISFAIGAAIPLLPFLFGAHSSTIILSMFLTGLTLFIMGVTLSLFTNRNPLYLGIRMLLIGGIAGGLTYAIGALLGITLA